MTYQENRPERWYSSEPMKPSEIEAWYGDPITAHKAVSANDAPAKEQTKKQRRSKLVWLSVCAVLLAAAIITAIPAVRTVRQIRAAAEAVYSGPAGTETEDGYQRDYRDYFAQYYTSSSAVAIERIEADEGVELTLHSKAGLEELSLQDIYAGVNPAIVGITTFVNDRESGWGTGILFTADGYIVTNAHIIQGAQAASVSLTTGEVYEAYLIGEDEQSDIAVLKIDGEGLPYAEFGDSDELVVGDSVAAIGNPLGELYAGTMTNGIVSSISRSVMKNGYTMSLLQTNAALNEGNSGGALINMYGQVIGITNMKIMAVYYSTVEGIGFAVPSATVKNVADQLLKNGVVSGEPTIGITAASVSDEAIIAYGLPEGIYVTAVDDGSDAKTQGLAAGDIITGVNGISVATVSAVNAIKDEFEVGDTLTLTVYRDGVTFEIDIKLIDKTMLQN